MDSALDRLKALDPSDNMEATMEAIAKALEYARSHKGTENASIALGLISEKEQKAREYYLRPLDSDHIYNVLVEVHNERGEKDLIKKYLRCLDLRQARKWTILGDCYSLMGMNKRAVIYLKRALFFGPMEDLVDEVKETLDKAEKRMEKAIQEVDGALARSEDKGFEPKSAAKAVGLLIDLERLEEAASLLRKALKDSPDDPELLYKKGCLMFAKGDFKPALKHFGKLLEENPKSNNLKRAVNISEEMIKGVL